VLDEWDEDVDQRELDEEALQGMPRVNGVPRRKSGYDLGSSRLPGREDLS
jgi:hypothetical protein